MSNHEVDVGQGVIQAFRFQFFFAHAVAVGKAGWVSCTDSQVAGGVFIIQCFEVDTIGLTDWGVVVYESHFAEISGALVGFDKVFSDVPYNFCIVVNDFAVFKSKMEFIDFIALINKRLCAVHNAVNPIVLRGTEYFFGWNVGIEDGSVFSSLCTALPQMVFRKINT